jgi:hypothetical protein
MIVWLHLQALLVTILENFLVLVPLLFQAGLEVRISRYTIRLLESQLLIGKIIPFLLK